MSEYKKRKPILGSPGKVIRSGNRLVVQNMGRVIDTYQPASYNLGYQVWEYQETQETWSIPYSVYEYQESLGYDITPA